MSKANQKFVQADEAVSPVIGVILMVAITVVLAAVVFVLVSNLGEGSESAPNVSFNKDSSARTLTVVRADSGLEWQDFTFSLTPSSSPACALTDSNGDATQTVAGEFDTGADDIVSAGDVLTVSVGSGESGTCSFSLNHVATNTLVYTTSFEF